MTKAIEKDNRYPVARNVHFLDSHARRPTPLIYVVARDENNVPMLLHIPLGFGEETMPVFSSWGTARNFALSYASGEGWYVKECSAGELVSLLLRPYAGIEWVLFDPLPGRLSAGDAPANLMGRERFLDYLLLG
jgi:hypothetical protein